MDSAAAISAATASLPGQPDSAAAVLEAILSDPFLEDIISERPATTALSISSPSTHDPAAAGPTGSSTGLAAAAAAGPTGSSVSGVGGVQRLSDADAVGLGGEQYGERITLTRK